MAKQTARELTDPRSYITFDDIIALALAKTKSNQFNASSSKWQEVLYDIRERFKGEIVELRMMLFDESRSDIPPQSEEFYQLINILSAAKLISLPNPTYENILMDNLQKERAVSLEERLLRKYENHINDIADIIEEKLAVRS